MNIAPSKACRFSPIKYCSNTPWVVCCPRTPRSPMSSPAYALPLRIDRRFSRGLAIAVVLVHTLAIAVVLPLDVAWWWKCLIAIAVGTQAVFSWRLHVCLTAARAVHAVLWKCVGDWLLTRTVGTALNARLRRAV